MALLDTIFGIINATKGRNAASRQDELERLLIQQKQDRLDEAGDVVGDLSSSVEGFRRFQDEQLSPEDQAQFGDVLGKFDPSIDPITGVVPDVAGARAEVAPLISGVTGAGTIFGQTFDAFDEEVTRIQEVNAIDNNLPVISTALGLTQRQTKDLSREGIQLLLDIKEKQPKLSLEEVLVPGRGTGIVTVNPVDGKAKLVTFDDGTPLLTPGDTVTSRRVLDSKGNLVFEEFVGTAGDVATARQRAEGAAEGRAIVEGREDLFNKVGSTNKLLGLLERVYDLRVEGEDPVGIAADFLSGFHGVASDVAAALKVEGFNNFGAFVAGFKGGPETQGFLEERGELRAMQLTLAAVRAAADNPTAKSLKSQQVRDALKANAVMFSPNLAEAVGAMNGLARALTTTTNVDIKAWVARHGLEAGAPEEMNLKNRSFTQGGIAIGIRPISVEEKVQAEKDGIFMSIDRFDELYPPLGTTKDLVGGGEEEEGIEGLLNGE